MAMFSFIILAALTLYGAVEGEIKLCEGTQLLSCPLLVIMLSCTLVFLLLLICAWVLFFGYS